MSGFDPRDSTSVDTPVPNYVAELDKAARGPEIGLIKEFFDKGLDAAVEKCIREALKGIREARARRLVEVKLPALPLSVPTYYVVAPAECSSNLARFDGVRYGYRCQEPKDLMDLYKRSRGEGFGAEVKRRIMTGTYVLSAGYYDAYYLKAQRVRQLINQDFKRAFGEVDVLMGPTAPDVAFGLGAKASDPIQMYLNDIYTIGANLAGVPAMSIPCGFVRDLPVGLQICGPHFGGGQAAERGACLPAGDRLASPDSGGLRPGGAVVSAPISSKEGGWETVIGLEIHAQLSTASKIFSGSAHGLRRLAELAGQPGRPRVSRRIAGAEPGSRAHGGEVRARGIGDRDRAVGVRAQELLLPGPAEGLPDQPVRAAHRRPGATWTSCSTTAARSASASRVRTSRKTPANRCTKGWASSRAST
jgi:hypothetical protein